jgi:hypothetical protein
MCLVQKAAQKPDFTDHWQRIASKVYSGSLPPDDFRNRISFLSMARKSAVRADVPQQRA